MGKRKKTSKKIPQEVKSLALTVMFIALITILVISLIKTTRLGTVGKAYNYGDTTVDLSDYPFPFIEDNQLNTEIVVGDDAPNEDLESADIINDSLMAEIIPTQNLVAEWKFDEESGTIAYDSAGDYDGEIVGPTWISGVSGSALEFDGVDDYINISSSLQDLNEWTMLAWVKHKGTWGGYEDIITTPRYDDPVDFENYPLIFDDGKPDMYDSGVTADNAIDNSWHLIATSCNGTNGTVYVDGVEVKSGSCYPTSADFIGVDIRDGDTYEEFNGTLDEIKIYSYALSEAEVEEIYNTESAGLECFTNEDCDTGEYCDGNICVSGLLAEWKFDEGSGTLAADSAGDNDGEILGASWMYGVNGSALEFDGSDDYVDLGDPTDGSLDLETEITILAWIKPNLTGTLPTIFSKYNSNTDRYEFSLNSYEDYKLTFSINGGSSLTSNNPPTNGIWNHVGATYNGTTGVVYLNGVADNSFDFSCGDTCDVGYSANALIGSRTGGTLPFNGVIDEVKIYRYALSEAEIEEIYNTELSVGLEPNLLAEWKFDEGSGTSAADSAGDYDGEIIGPVWTTAGVSGSALEFDGVDDYISLSSLPNLNKWTMSAWVKHKGDWNAWEDIITTPRYDYPGDFESYPLIFDDGKPNIYESGIIADNVIDNNWHLVVTSCNGTNGKIYVDGAEVKSGSCYPAGADIIGADVYEGSTAEEFNGTIDEVKIYSYDLSAAEIEEIYNTESALIECFTNDDCDIGEVCESNICVSGLLAEWKFDEGSGTSAADSAGDYDGEIVGSAVWVDGVSDSALEFDGEEDYINIPYNQDLEPDEITISLWVKQDSADYGPILSNYEDSYGYWIASTSISSIYWWLGHNTDETSRYSESTVADGNWHHITVSSDGSTAKVYVDGVLEDSESTSPIVYSPSNIAITIGKDIDDSSFFKGNLDEVKIYRYVLSEAEVEDIYNTESAEIPTGSFILTGLAVLASDIIGTVDQQNVIAVGNPCNNSVVDNFTSCEGWNYSEGQAMIKLFQNGDNLALVAAGTTVEDTRRAALVLANYEDFNLTGDEVCVEGDSLELDDISVTEGPCAVAEEVVCTDSDGGINYTVVGECIDSNYPSGIKDFCENSGELLEMYCDQNNQCVSELHTCDGQCMGGVCFTEYEIEPLILGDIEDVTPHDLQVQFSISYEEDGDAHLHNILGYINPDFNQGRWIDNNNFIPANKPITIEIDNSGASATEQMINITYDGNQEKKVYLPAIPGGALNDWVILFVADDGSTYYGCEWDGASCGSFIPSIHALTPQNLAREAYVELEQITIQLEPGWNLISIPLVLENDNIEDVLADISDDVIDVYAYDPEEEWSVWHPDPAIPSNLDTIELGKGYWFKMNDSAELAVEGVLFETTELEPPPSFALKQGWNLVGIYSLEDREMTTALASIEDVYSALWSYNKTSGELVKLFSKADPAVSTANPVLEAGKGYWVYMIQEGAIVP